MSFFTERRPLVAAGFLPFIEPPWRLTSLIYACKMKVDEATKPQGRHAKTKKHKQQITKPKQTKTKEAKTKKH